MHEEDHEEAVELVPHAYVACDGRTLFQREPHCVVCERPERDDIHKVTKDMPEVVAA